LCLDALVDTFQPFPLGEKKLDVLLLALENDIAVVYVEVSACGCGW